MTEILSSLITPELRIAFTIILIVLGILYLLSIVWVVRDSYLRGASPLVWGIVSVIPFIGCMVYAMMRPPLYASDQEEQNIDLLLKQRQLMSYGECPQCGYPTERDYIICPNCHVKLKNVCPACGHSLEPEWTLCPYCGGKGNVAGSQRQVTRVQNANRRTQRPAKASDSSAASAPVAAAAAAPAASATAKSARVSGAHSGKSGRLATAAKRTQRGSSSDARAAGTAAAHASGSQPATQAAAPAAKAPAAAPAKPAASAAPAAKPAAAPAAKPATSASKPNAASVPSITGSHSKVKDDKSSGTTTTTTKS